LGPKSKKKIFCRVPWGALGKNVFAECRAQEALGKICFQKIIKKICRVSKDGTQQSFFLKKIKTNFAECLMAGTRQNLTVGGRRHGPAKFCRVPDFAKCKILPSATLGKILLCRVPRYFALGKVSGTRQSTVFQ